MYKGFIMLHKFERLKEYKTWVLKLSGGADSALILYYMNKIRTDQEVWILTGVNGNDKNYAEHTRDIINHIGIKDVAHVMYPQTHIRGHEKYERDHSFYGKLVSCWSVGSTIGLQGRSLNPPFYIEGEEENRNGSIPEIETINGFPLYRPWHDVTKRDIVRAYREEGQMDLFDKTRSCVSMTVDQCGECFWCKEREWALDE